MIVTREYLRSHPTHIFVFGDNLKRKGKKGAAELRDEPNTYGFVTKRAPNNLDQSFYRPENYRLLFEFELKLLEMAIEKGEYTFLISQLGAGLANKYNIWEKVIKPRLESLRKYPNVVFLWEK